MQDIKNYVRMCTVCKEIVNEVADEINLLTMKEIYENVWDSGGKVEFTGIETKLRNIEIIEVVNSDEYEERALRKEIDLGKYVNSDNPHDYLKSIIVCILLALIINSQEKTKCKGIIFGEAITPVIYLDTETSKLYLEISGKVKK